MRHSASRKRHGRRKASAGDRRRLLLLPALMLSLVLGLPTSALAYWTTTGSGQRTATTATLAAPASVTATSTAGSNSATITWTASPSGAPTGYRVERSANGGGSWTTACAQASYPTAGSCTESALANGTYQYRVVALKGSWTAPRSAASSITIARDTVAPTVTIDQAPAQADPARTQPINFSIVFSEPVTGFTSAGIQISLGAGVSGPASVTLSGSGSTYNAAIGGLGNPVGSIAGGTVRATVLANQAIDVGGNGNGASTSTDNVVSLDTIVPVAPAAPTLSPGSDSGRLSDDRITNVLTPTFTGTVPAGEVGSTVTLSRWSAATGGSQTIVGTGIVSATGTYSITSSTTPTSTAADGVVYHYAVSVTDRAGNVGPEGPRTSMTLDTIAPAATVTAGSVNLLAGSVSVSGARGATTNDLAALNGGTLTLTYCGVSTVPCPAANVIATGTLTGTSATWSTTQTGVSLLGLSSVYVNVAQTDVAGNTGRMPASFRAGSLLG